MQNVRLKTATVGFLCGFSRLNIFPGNLGWSSYVGQYPEKMHLMSEWIWSPQSLCIALIAMLLIPSIFKRKWELLLPSHQKPTTLLRKTSRTGGYLFKSQRINFARQCGKLTDPKWEKEISTRTRGPFGCSGLSIVSEYPTYGHKMDNPQLSNEKRALGCLEGI